MEYRQFYFLPLPKHFILNKLLFSILIILGGCLNQLSAHSSNSGIMQADTLLPTVFLIGEFETQYTDAIQNYETLLITACDNDMDEAYTKWVSMLEEMEAYSEEIDFDLKGLKGWFNIFWEPNGQISHFAYYLRPVSKNLDLEELNAFFNSFIKNYRFPLVYDKKYSHYGTASFPVFAKIMQKAQEDLSKGQN